MVSLPTCTTKTNPSMKLGKHTNPIWVSGWWPSTIPSTDACRFVSHIDNCTCPRARQPRCCSNMLWNRSNYRQQTSEESHGTRQKNYDTYFYRNQKQKYKCEWVFSTLAYFEVTWSPQINLWGLRRTCSIVGGTNDYLCTPVKTEIERKYTSWMDIPSMFRSSNPPTEKIQVNFHFFKASFASKGLDPGIYFPIFLQENKDIWPNTSKYFTNLFPNRGVSLPQLPWGRWRS